ncbi:hypothetical protein OAF27_03400 [Verrucomicrobiales bacterium]|nr:hypothetical protein [Verrucomicrobiales bacterium]
MNMLTLSLASALAVGLLIGLLVNHKTAHKQHGFRRIAVVVASIALIVLGILNQNGVSSMCASIMLIIEFQNKPDEGSKIA